MDKNKDLILPASILVAAIMISASIMYSGGGINTEDTVNVGENNNQTSLTVTDRDVLLGSENAPVTLIVYSDYQCPFCAKFFAESEAKIKAEYVKNGQVKLVHRNFAFLGEESVLSAEAAECAKEQGKFWDYHDALFAEEVKDARENNGNLKKELFMKLAQNLSLDSKKFEECINTRRYRSLVEEDVNQAASVGVESTPTIFVNGLEIRGAQPYQEFKSAIDRALRES